MAVRAFLTRDTPETVRRLAVCDDCWMNDRGFCGTPGQFVDDQSDQQLGCWCNLRLAARLPKKKCWLRENLPDQDEGW